LTAFQGYHHGPLVEITGLAVFQQPAVHDLDAGHALKDAGDDDLGGQLAVTELDFEFVADLDAIQASAIDIGRVHQVIITGDDVNVPLV
jgi:hypothetical protein